MLSSPRQLSPSTNGGRRPVLASKLNGSTKHCGFCDALSVSAVEGVGLCVRHGEIVAQIAAEAESGTAPRRPRTR